MDLVELLKRPEGKILGFKRELSAPEGALTTIVALANTAGGTLLVGVEDKRGHVRGVAEPLDLEERMANLISDHVAPRLVPEIGVLPWRRTQVLAVRVHPGPRAARTISSARNPTDISSGHSQNSSYHLAEVCCRTATAREGTGNAAVDIARLPARGARRPSRLTGRPQGESKASSKKSGGPMKTIIHL